MPQSMGLFMSAIMRLLHLSDECDTAEHLGWQRLIKHCPLGVLDRIFTCCLGDIWVFQLRAQTIASLQLLLFIQYRMMLLLSTCKTRAEPSLSIVSFGLQLVAFSFCRPPSPVVHQGQSVESRQSGSGGRVNDMGLSYMSMD